MPNIKRQEAEDTVEEPSRRMRSSWRERSWWLLPCWLALPASPSIIDIKTIECHPVCGAFIAPFGRAAMPTFLFRSLRHRNVHLLFGTTMAQHAHIPKFGNWDSENIPYSAHFEMALKDKDAGSKISNPNDPEENPQAYNPRIYAQDHQHSERHRNDHTPTDYRVLKQHRKKHHSMEDGDFQGSMKAPLHRRPTFRRVNTGTYRSRNFRSSASVSSSDKISSNNSLVQPRHHRKSTKDLAEGSHGFSSSLAHDGVAKMGNSREGKAQQHRAASVPRFGSWDEKDPQSEESFTVIFNRVKEEKQMASTRLPTLPAKPITCPVGRNDYCHASSKSKIWCCIFPPAAKWIINCRSA